MGRHKSKSVRKTIDLGDIVIKPRRSMGQNFLMDKRIGREIVASIPYNMNNNIVEIGPGSGILTQFLLERNNKITVVELDRELFINLSNGYKKYTSDRLIIINDDILRIPEILFYEEPFIISNLPYNISTAIITLLLDNTPMNKMIDSRSFKGCILMLQKEMVDRLVSTHNSRTYGKISVQFQLKMEYEPLFDVQPESFFPSPKVRSTVIKFKPSDERDHDIDELVLRKLLNMCFSGRRKKLKNTVNSSYFSGDMTDEMLFDIFKDHNILDKRAENITPLDYLAISRSIERCL
ncbi:MAG: ribosomal RNA small subunit methyltransferase A [Thermoplasmata archaeon]|nr:ribosomal RNA small subunit methyltransferase A [Thermoplasmata archaeon]